MAYAHAMRKHGEGAGWERLFWLVFQRTSNPIALLDDQRRRSAGEGLQLGLHGHRGAGHVHGGAHLDRGSPRSGSAARLEVLPALGLGAGQGDRESKPGRGVLLPLPGQCSRAAAADRRSPRRGHRNLPLSPARAVPRAARSGCLWAPSSSLTAPRSPAPVLIQARTVSRKGEVVNKRMLAETTTDSAGKWELDATPMGPAGHGMWLRALCPSGHGFGAGVSEPLHVTASVSLTAPAVSPPAATARRVAG